MRLRSKIENFLTGLVFCMHKKQQADAFHAVRLNEPYQVKRQGTILTWFTCQRRQEGQEHEREESKETGGQGPAWDVLGWAQLP